VTNVKNLTLCKTEQYRTLPPVCTWIENHSLVGGLGVEDQQNSLRVIYFCGVGPRDKSNNQNQENGKEQQIRDTVPQLLIIS
jgi:hypothetical protein